MHSADFQELPIFELLKKNTLQDGACHVLTKRYLYERSHITKAHRHSFFSIELITGGSCVQYINGYRHDCPPGAVCLMSPFDYHQFQLDDGGVSTRCLSFAEDVLTLELFQALNNTEMPCFLILKEEERDAFVRDLQLLEQEIAQKKPMYVSVVNSVTNKLVACLLRNGTAVIADTANRKSDIRYSISYVRNHFREPITLSGMADTFHVTQNHFCKYFKKITGLTFKEYLLQLRLDHAMKQLLLTQSSITEICFESGFHSPSYFSKAFKARFGKTPGACRETGL